MDAETYGTTVLPIRSKARKAYDQALRSKAPKSVLKALLAAKTAAEQWADSVNPYREDEPTDDEGSDSDADTGTRVEVEPVKAKPPVKRVANVTRIEARS